MTGVALMPAYGFNIILSNNHLEAFQPYSYTENIFLISECLQ